MQKGIDNMIKYFLIFIGISTALFSLEQEYILKVSEGIREQSVSHVDTINIYEEPEQMKEACTKEAKTVDKKISSPKDITIFTDKNIPPINYTNTISLNKLQVSVKKQKFFHMILPAVLISKQKLKVARTRVRAISNSDAPSSEDILFLEDLYSKYKTDNTKELLSRMKTHPVSIVLAQAAIESGWGESRFFKKGNNIFGMWSVSENEPRMRAKGTRNGKPVYLRTYKTLSDAIDHYFVTIGRGAYKSFRKKRDITDNPLQLVQYLVNYCELKEKYTKKLSKFIVHNKLRKFDEFQIDKAYLTQQ